MAIALALITVPAVAWALTSPRTTVDLPAEAAEVHGRLDIGGTASHRVGVAGVRLVVRNIEDNTYFNGESWQQSFIRFDVPVHHPGASKTRWSYSIPDDKLKPGEYRARAFAYSVEGNGDGFGGDWNEFTYLGRYDPELYDTEISAPADGGIVSGAVSVTGIARSSDGVASVRVVVRNIETNQYRNANNTGWQSSFAAVQAELSDNTGGVETTWTVAIPADQMAPGTYFTRAWLRTTSDHGDPIGRGQSTFTVEASEPPVTTTEAPTTTTVESTTTEAPIATTEAPTTTVTEEPSTTAATAEPTTTAKQTTTTAADSTTTTAAPTTTSTTARPTTSTTSTTAEPGARRPFGQGSVDWRLVASDNFNGSRLDDNMWEYGWWGASDGNAYDRPVNGNETACYHTDQVTLARGELSLTMRPTTAAENTSGVCRKKDGSQAYFVSGYATTRERYQIQPGTYVETRMWMPGEGNVLYNWPAFWVTDMDRALGSRWPHSGEFDIAEILKGQACANYHYAQSAGGTHLQTGKRCSSVGPNRWAVFGMKWNHDGTVEIFHDGKPVQDRGDGGDWIIDPLDLAGPFAIDYTFNIALQHGMNVPEKAGYKEPTAANPLTVKFDYVDVYKLP